MSSALLDSDMSEKWENHIFMIAEKDCLAERSKRQQRLVSVVVLDMGLGTKSKWFRENAMNGSGGGSFEMPFRWKFDVSLASHLNAGAHRLDCILTGASMCWFCENVKCTCIARKSFVLIDRRECAHIRSHPNETLQSSCALCNRVDCQKYVQVQKQKVPGNDERIGGFLQSPILFFAFSPGFDENRYNNGTCGTSMHYRTIIIIMGAINVWRVPQQCFAIRLECIPDDPSYCALGNHLWSTPFIRTRHIFARVFAFMIIMCTLSIAKMAFCILRARSQRDPFSHSTRQQCVQNAENLVSVKQARCRPRPNCPRWNCAARQSKTLHGVV